MTSGEGAMAGIGSLWQDLSMIPGFETGLLVAGFAVALAMACILAMAGER